MPLVHGVFKRNKDAKAKRDDNAYNLSTGESKPGGCEVILSYNKPLSQK